MPIYVFECRACHERFEKVLPFSASLDVQCPHGHEDVKRLFTPPAIHFKGSGWYITDSRKNGKANGAAEGSSGEKDKPEAGKEKGSSD
ncbi:MAG: zinc ribbon domain-containing protein [Anaerolineae bacterium]